MERLTLKKISDVEVKEQGRFKVSHRFAALKNLHDDNFMGINKSVIFLGRL